MNTKISSARQNPTSRRSAQAPARSTSSTPKMNASRAQRQSKADEYFSSYQSARTGQNKTSSDAQHRETQAADSVAPQRGLPRQGRQLDLIGSALDLSEAGVNGLDYLFEGPEKGKLGRKRFTNVKQQRFGHTRGAGSIHDKSATDKIEPDQIYQGILRHIRQRTGQIAP